MKEKKVCITTVVISTIVMFALFSCTLVEPDSLMEESNSPVKSTQTESEKTKEKSDKQSLARYYKQLEKSFSEAVDGIPLSYPLVEMSDPSLFLMPVADDSTMHVQRLYLIDSTHGFSYDHSIYSLDSIYYYIDAEEPLRAIVSRMDGLKTSFIIDGFMYHKIIQINKNNEYSSNLVIPVIKIPAITNMPEK